ncbi:MAG: GtrA family protein [Planctomycetes bacterium]|nr:GtrA family protein [Planctomycetota bacterium]
MLETLVRRKTNNVLVQVFRYGFVAVAAFAVDFTSLFLFTEWVGLHYLISAVLAFGCGLTTNYTLSVCWVFSERRVRNRRIEFAINATIALIGLGLNILLIWLFTEFVGLHYLVSKLISTATVFWWNFLVKKKLLFTARTRTQAPLPTP